MENEKQNNLKTFENCKNIIEQDVLEFLKEQGYYISNFKCSEVQNENLDEYSPDHLFSFNNYDELDYQTYNHRLVLLASPDTWKNTDLFENFHENYLSTKCRNNPFVRYIYFTISDFKVYEVLTDRKYPSYLTTKLENDLSKEWVQFLARQKENYKPSLIQLMIKRKELTLEKLERCKEATQKEKERLDEDLNKMIISTKKEVESFDQTTEWLEELN